MLVVAGAPCTMRPSFLPFGVHDPDAASSTTIDVALGIHLHAVGDPGLGAAQICEHAVAEARVSNGMQSGPRIGMQKGL